LPLIRRGYKEGLLYLLVSGILIILFALAVILLKLSVIVVILGAAFLGALFFARKPAASLLENEQGNGHD
jgi:ABC-type Co2+ transport system permease subunit